MDLLDRKIIGELQRNGRISVTDLAERLPLSLSATSERLKRLLDTGVITGFHARVDPELAGRAIEALVDVRLGPGAHSRDPDFADPVFAGVIDAVHLTGRFDVQLHVMTHDVAELDRLLERLKDEMGAEETNTRLVLRQLEGFP
ncbi:MAG: Lrp/AsnC family transcriptional regulator, partial [Actinomycetota bacterium]